MSEEKEIIYKIKLEGVEEMKKQLEELIELMKKINKTEIHHHHYHNNSPFTNLCADNGTANNFQWTNNSSGASPLV